MDLDDLRSAIDALAAPLVPAAATWDALARHVRPRSLRRGEHLLRPGDPVDAAWFVREGILRYYYLSDGAEHTGQFFDAGHVVTDVAAAATGGPAIQAIDAVTAASILILPLHALREAMASDHAMERWQRRLLEQAMAGSQRRSAALLQRTAQERYEGFVLTRPEVARLVPQYVIASYLGITPEALSRIRRRRGARR